MYTYYSFILKKKECTYIIKIIVIFIIFLFFSSYSYGQSIWTKPRFCFRYGLVTQKSFYHEIGISRHTYCFGASKSFYTSLEVSNSVFENNKDVVYGGKIGYEITSFGLIFGVESKYLKNKEDGVLYFTPKTGFGLWGVILLCYGYNLPLNNTSQLNIGEHQFSIILNLNRKNIVNLNTIN